jgi:hypothetical protein
MIEKRVLINLLYFLYLVLTKIKERVSYQPCFLRGIVMIVDFNDIITLRDYEFTPNKCDNLYSKILEFAKKFFEHNFLSCLTLIGLIDFQATTICALAYDYINFVQDINNNWPKFGSGKPSLYNAFLVSIVLIV